MTPVLVRAVASAAFVVAMAGCTGPGTGSSLPTCGAVTPSTGLLRDVLQVQLSGPATLATGSQFRGAVTVSLRPGVDRRQVSLTSGAPVREVIARGTDVVGQYEGAVGRVGIPAVITPDRPFRFREPGSVLLSDCPHRPVDGVDPDGSRKPLPPGHYTVYAYVDDLSGHSTSDYGVLRSQPFEITLTAVK